MCTKYIGTLLGTSVLASFAALSPPAKAEAPVFPLADTAYLWDARPPEALATLGQALFFDPILSGNRNISCGTCHDPRHGTGDALALGIGEGGNGFGTERRTEQPVTGRIPRNAPALFNIGARAFRNLFHDGRVEMHPDGSVVSPFEGDLPEGLTSALSVQAMFPVLSPAEMAGQAGENPVADAVFAEDDELAWRLLADRLRKAPAYVELFGDAFADIERPDDITYVHAAEALAAFQTVAFRTGSSPFDLALAGEPLPKAARLGMELFFGRAGCSECHSGPLLTDHDFHAIAMPQIGPGRNDGADTSYRVEARFGRRLEDEGRYDVTGDPDDLFRFRTPSLRNVAITGPWGHTGAFDTLEAVVRHHANPVRSLRSYVPADLPPLGHVVELHDHGPRRHYRPVTGSRRDGFDARDTWVQSTPLLRDRIEAANELAPISLSDTETAALVAFLETLTDEPSRDLSDLIP
ncbi:MAG: cytochrome c peroxidase, partial [Pseudomonadota bacterium]